MGSLRGESVIGFLREGRRSYYFLIMLGRFLGSMGRAAMPAFKPVFSAFPKQTMTVQKMYCWLT